MRSEILLYAHATDVCTGSLDELALIKSSLPADELIQSRVDRTWSARFVAWRLVSEANR